MADLNTSLQFANIPLPSDLPFYNYGSTQIASGLVVAIDTVNTMDGTVGNDGPGIVVGPTASNVALIGITMENINGTNLNAAGANAGRVRTLGIAVATADGTIAAGGTVGTNGATTAGHVIATASSTKSMVGYALTAAVAGDPILVLVMPAPSVASATF